MRIFALPLLASVSAFAIPCAPASAQQATAGENDDFHNTPRTITITAEGVGELDILAGTSVVEGDELQRNMAGQVGDILADLPGVSATSFSPGASRPVLRGFSGERVKVLTDGLGNLDASNTSSDHAVSLDPLTTERIEVLRGPAVLLYGSQAIGGAVNLIDKRIPRSIPDEPVHVDAIAGVGTVDDRREIGGSIDVRASDMVAVHFDASYRNTDDVEIPGYVASPGLRADILADAAEEEAEGHVEEADELREAANQRGVLPDSATETYSYGGGVLIGDDVDFLGFSVGRYDTDYGVPLRPGGGHHHHGEEEEGEDHEHEGEDGHEHGEEGVSIGLKQTRADVRGGLGLGGIIDRVDFRLGYSDYTHTEFEGEEVGTVFDVEGYEGRLVFTQQDTEAWRGSFGGQTYYRDFEAVGEEAFVAPNETTQYALFTLQEFGSGPLTFEAGGRYEHTETSAKILQVDRNFNSFSGAVSAVYRPVEGLRVGVTGSRAERAPAAEELFSDGPHIATQQYEVGNLDLDTEKAWGAELFARGDIGDVTFNLAAYAQWFEDYIYLAATGDELDDLPVYAFQQDDARYYGFEGQVLVPLYQQGDTRIGADLRADYVRAQLDDDSNLPLIPPLSLYAALEGDTGPFGGRVEVAYTAEQEKIAAYETPTDDFMFVNASLSWEPFDDNNVTLLAQVRNIFDAEGRRHASATKDFVPLAGRDFRLSARMSF